MLFRSEQSQVLQHLRAEFVFGQHATNSFLQNHLRSALKHLTGRENLTTARITREPLVGSLFELLGVIRRQRTAASLTREANSVSIHDDDHIAAYDVSRVVRLVLTHQDSCDLCRETTDDLIVAINDEPIWLCFFGLYDRCSLDKGDHCDASRCKCFRHEPAELLRNCMQFLELRQSTPVSGPKGSGKLATSLLGINLAGQKTLGRVSIGTLFSESWVIWIRDVLVSESL